MMRRAIVVFCLVAGLTQNAHGQTYRAILGERTIGTVEYTGSGRGADRIDRMFTNLNNTPMGVGEGTFEAISRPVVDGRRRLRQYTGVSRSSRDGRSITVLHHAGKVERTDIMPDRERTELSQPDRVPAGIVDLAQAFGRFARASSCPAPFLFYDGRRVIDVRTLSSDPSGAGLSCKVDYRVVAGPGHLSPLRFTKIDLVLVYDANGVLNNAAISAGPFTLSLRR